MQQILVWADIHHQRTGQWPKIDTGQVIGAAGEIWMNVDAALKQGLRGLPGGSSLIKLLAMERGVRNHLDIPELTIADIVDWARAYFEDTGSWPTEKSPGQIPNAPQETWRGIGTALRVGRRGLPGGSSLAQILAQECGVQNRG